MSTTEEQVNDEPLTPQVAPLWIRACAEGIDLALLCMVFCTSLLLGAVTGLWWIVVPICLAFRIAAIYRCPPSPGKRAMGLHLTRGDRTPCTRWEMVGFDLMQLPAVGRLLFRCEALWKTSVVFDGEWRRTARDHLEDTFLIHCPELSGEVRDPAIDYEALERERSRERARASVATAAPAAPSGQRSLFSDEGLVDAEEEKADAEEELPGLLTGRGTVHIRGVDGRPLCGSKPKGEMTPTDEEITCQRCLRPPGGSSKSKKGADAA